MNMSEPYLLNRDASESQRLTQQHELWSKSLGYLIHPSIAPTLPEDASIADIGTGTGVWPLAIVRERPKSQVYGFDISSAQFMPLDLVPPNIHLHVHNLWEPFPEEMLGRFHFVHARLLLLAMADQEAWTSAVKNLSTLLKPGGWLQWEDGDFPSVHAALRTAETTEISTEALRKGLGILLSLTDPRPVNMPEKLHRAFQDSDFSNIDTDTVASDRLPEFRKLGTKMEIGAAEGVIKQHRQAVQAGTVRPIPGTPDGDAELIRQMHKEADSGGYCVFFIQCIFGRKGV